MNKYVLPKNVEHFLSLRVEDGTYESMEEAVNALLSTALTYDMKTIYSGKVPDIKEFGYYTYEDSEIPEEFSFPLFDEPMVSIIIPVYNQYSYTHKCLWSILQNAKDISYEIIIADDNSTDKTNAIQNYVHNIKVSRNAVNLGYLKNCNKAAKLAVGKYLYFMNNDTIAQPNWLNELVNTFDIKKDAGVVGSKVLLPDYTMQECGVYLFNDLTRGDYQSNPANSMHNYLKEADYVSGCSLMTPRKLFNEIGGFDELFAPAYSEDPDYCLSALMKGYKTYVQPKSRIMHYGSQSYSTKTKELVKKNRIKLYTKWKDYFKTRTEFKFYKIPFSAKTRPATMLMIDHFMPEFDRHAGAKTIYQFIELFASKGINVKYCPIGWFERQEPYYSILTQMGIQVIEKESIMKYIQKMGKHIDYLFLSRPEVAKIFLDDYFKTFKAKFYITGMIYII